ncbi:MAG: hypothetical protein ABIA63_09440 [bacterium]
MSIEIDVRRSNVYIAPIQDQTNIKSNSKWPKDASSQTNLINILNLINSEITENISRFQRAGQYHTVDIRQKADVIVQIILFPYMEDANKISFPITLLVQYLDKEGRAQKDYTVNLDLNKYKSQKSNYHYWGAILNDLRHNFPYKKIAGQFYPE